MNVNVRTRPWPELERCARLCALRRLSICGIAPALRCGALSAGGIAAALRGGALSLAAVVLVAACGSDDPETPSADDADAPGAGMHADGGAQHGDAGAAAGGGGTSTASPLAGWFTVKLVPEMAATPVRDATEARTAVTGKLADGPTPEATIWTATAHEGDCELLTPRVPFCDPDCGGTALCVDDGVCMPYPTAQSVGVVRAIGLGAEFSMQPIAGNYQPPAGTVLAYPPCDEGDEIRLEAAGDAYDPFTLAARCVAPMVFPGPVRIEPGEPLALQWTAAQPDVARVRVSLDISHHGGSKGKIECDAADTGSLEIAAALVQQLVDLGVAGFPSVVVTRLHAGNGSSEQSQAVTLTISSSMENQVEIPGLRSCTADAQCPSGHCLDDLTCE